MIYSFDGRVRYSEIGENGLLTLPGVLNYFQDCSTFQSEEVGLGIKVLKEWKRFWVLSAWQVIVERYPAMGEQIRTSTWAYGFRGFMGFRNFTMDTMEGERLAYANTFWTYINRENDFPVKLTERDMAWKKNWRWIMPHGKSFYQRNIQKKMYFMFKNIIWIQIIM